VGRRSRKRSDGPPTARPAVAEPPRVARASGRPTIDDRPKPPWHPVPLIEICVLAGIVLIIVGFLNTDSHRGRVALIRRPGAPSTAPNQTWRTPGSSSLKPSRTIPSPSTSR
jgi:hypothetical protein